MNRFFLVAAFLLVCCSVGGVCAQDKEGNGQADGESGWLDNAELALKIARETDKDLLMLFTGSDWCPPCKKLEQEIVGQPAFLEEATKRFVLLVFDFPEQKELLSRIKQQNQQWAQRFGVSGYPTLFLVDQQERPYAILGYQEVGVDGFLSLMDEKQQQRVRRDQFFAQAKGVEGGERAKNLDQALSEMDQDLANLYYEDLVEEIVSIDREDKLGLRTKWNAEADAEMRKIILTDIVTVSRFEKPERAVAFIDEVLNSVAFEPSQRLQIYQIKLSLYRKMSDQPGMDSVLDEMIGMEELTEVTRERLMVKKALALAGTERREAAMEMLDQALAKDQGKLHLWLAKGELLESQGRFAEAIKAFDKGIVQARVQPDLLIELIGSKADSLVASGDTLSAIRELDNFSDDKQMPTDLRGVALLHKAMIMRETDRRRQARLAENRAIEVSESPEQRAEMQKLVERLRKKFGE